LYDVKSVDMAMANGANADQDFKREISLTKMISHLSNMVGDFWFASRFRHDAVRIAFGN